MKVTDINSRDILLDKKKKENILICDISYKTLMGLIPLHNRFDEKDGCIKIYDGIRYLVLFVSGFNDETFDRIKYLMSKKKNGNTDSINHNFARIRIDSYKSLPIEKILTFHNVIILTKSVVNANKNHYYYIILLDKGLYNDKSKAQCF